jgi:hypothetical protein
MLAMQAGVVNHGWGLERISDFEIEADPLPVEVPP